ncbi:GNAT family N-acetyltransferase [Flavobacterium tegetincola]|uniref:GNAT family N-acetyltransferase n=1 Tax=Flavobacterium tegetincola TaxID=150172 RepID=UPI0003FCC6F8|nr:GNAT family N-acetyltransferase [Flavobacterium tegetincola]
MKIRKGQIEDMPRVLELIQELAAFELQPDAVEVTVSDLERDGFGTHPLFQILVADINGEIPGIALFYNRFSTWKGKTIHLEDLIVSEKYRGSGIGMQLYKAVMAEAKDQNVRRVEWNVLDWNTPAISFYEKTGAVVFKDWLVAQMDEEGLTAFLQNNK